MEHTNKRYVVGAFNVQNQRHIYFNDALEFPHLTENPSDGRAFTFDDIIHWRRPNVGDSVGEYMSNYGRLHVVDVD